MRPSPFAVIVAVPAVSACAGPQSVLDPKGPISGAVHGLFLVFLAVSALVLAGVLAALVAAVRRRRDARLDPDRWTVAVDAARERRTGRVVIGLTVATGLVIVALTVLSFLVGRVDTRAAEADMMTVHVTAHQWWWEFTYEAGVPSLEVVTADELRIPAGRPVRLELTAADVIHSLWIPALAGKKDLIPGRQNEMVVTADADGVYRAQCAEFCGLQHANMAFVVRAMPRAAFDAWLDAERAPAAPPQPGAASDGRAVFLRSGCVLCHRVRGTPAGGRMGPDLTHVGSRLTIAAGVLPNDEASLEAWIADPQAIKPGNRMPAVPLSADDRGALAAYLKGLR